MRLRARPMDAAAFAPHGALIEGPEGHGERRHFGAWVEPVAGLALQFHVNSVPASLRSVRLAQMERHPHAAQAFVPLDVGRYLVTVAPDAPEGGPDMGRALSMVLPGTVGVIYRAGCWHAGVTALDRDARFAVLMWRGAPDDDEFREVAPLAIAIDAALETTP